MKFHILLKAWVLLWSSLKVLPIVRLNALTFIFHVFLHPKTVSDVVTQTMLGAILIAVLLIFAIGYQFIRQVPHILRRTPTEYRARTLLLCAVYSIVGVTAFISLVAYRAFVFCDSVCHFTFLLCAYQFFVLIVDYVDGESNFIKETHGLMLFDMRTPPLCCCFRCLQPSAITKQVSLFSNYIFTQ